MSFVKRVAMVVTFVAGAVSVTAQTVDKKAATSTILKADRDFNQSVADHDVSRFLSFIAEAATFGGGDPQELHGREAVAKAWAQFFLPDGPKLSWKPLRGEVIGAGDIGYTVGSWERRTKSASGQPTVARGNYLTVWKKQADGSWKVVFDTGSAF